MRKRDPRNENVMITNIKVEVQRKRAAFPQDSQTPMIYKNTYKRTKIISTVRRIHVYLNP